MKVLTITAMYPSPERPHFGAFIRAQVEMLRKAGVEMKVFVLDGRSRKWIYPKGMIQLRQLLDDPSLDLIHAHYSYAGWVARTQTKLPIVVSFMGCDLLGSIDDDGQRSLLGRLDAAAAQRLALLVDGVIVKSPEMASKIKRPDVHVIPNEVNFDLFRVIDQREARAELGLDPARNYVLFAANPAEGRKGYPFARAVVERVQQDDPTLELVVVYKETQERLVYYLNACDALIFPSYQEGSPNIVKQAMACNLPVIATDVGDIRELVGTTPGCYVGPPDETAFARQLAASLQRGARTTGRQQISHLTPEAVTQRIVRVYESVLAHQSRGTQSAANISV